MKQILYEYMKTYADLSDLECEKLTREIKVKKYDRGSILITQGDEANKCFFILKGITRKYCIDDLGNEITVGFFSEKQSISIFYNYEKGMKSPYYVACIEDCYLIEGDLGDEALMNESQPELELMTNLMVQDITDQLQEDLSDFIRMTPEQKVENIIDKRPELLSRVPQYQLASFLGMTPESLSRIKKRIERRHLKAVE